LVGLGRRWDAVVEDVYSRMPSDVTPEEVEADITAAFRDGHSGLI
jgi:hypothetical protein